MRTVLNSLKFEITKGVYFSQVGWITFKEDNLFLGILQPETIRVFKLQKRAQRCMCFVNLHGCSFDTQDNDKRKNMFLTSNVTP